MLLFVISFTDASAIPEPTATHEPLGFVLSQAEMPIFELVTPKVNETYVQSLVSSLFGIHDILPQETEGIYFVNWSNSYFEVDSKDGSIWFADSGLQIMIDSGISRRVMSSQVRVSVRQLLKPGSMRRGWSQPIRGLSE